MLLSVVKLQSLMSEEAERIHTEGWLAFGDGNFELAEHKFTEAIALDPTNKEFREGKAISLKRQGKWDDALRDFDKMLELFPNYGTAWTQKARILNDHLFCEEAEMCANNALRLNSKDIGAWSQKGLALDLQHKLDEAMMCYDEMILLSPAEGWARKGVLLAFQYCDYENAIICCDKALQFDRENRIAWNGKGAANLALGLYEEAIKCYDRSLRWEDSPDVFFNKGVLLTFQGKFEEAEKCFQTACSLDPFMTDLFNGLGYLYLHQSKFQEAIKCFDKALVIDAEKSFASQGKVLCEYLMANPRPSTCPSLTGKSLQKLDKLNQTELYFYRGKTLMIFGEVEQAIFAFEKCLELNPNYKAAAIELDNIRQLRKREESS